LSQGRPDKGGLWLILALAALVLLARLAKAETYAYADTLNAFYADHRDARPDPEVVREAAEATQTAASFLCLDAQVDTMLSQWHRESAYDPASVDGDSRGISQVRIRELPRWRAFWAARGVRLGNFYTSVQTQAFYGVAAFYEKLQAAHGNVHEAVKSYNGRGRMARRYAHRVFISRKIIFGRPWRPGERQATGC
jgi:hypothetical protein